MKMKERILKHLQLKGKITTWDAILDYGCTRLSEYIRQLRKEYVIDDKWINGTNRYGEKTEYKEYFIVRKIK